MEPRWVFSRLEDTDLTEFNADRSEAAHIFRALNSYHDRESVCFGEARNGPQFQGIAGSNEAHDFIKEEVEDD